MTIGNTLKQSAIAAGVAAVINAIIFFIAKSQGWISDEFQVPENGPIGIGAILFSSIVPSIIGGALYWICTKFLPSGALIFWIIAMVILFWSNFNPGKMIPNVSDSMVLTLNVMHTVVASALLYFLTGRKENAFA